MKTREATRLGIFLGLAAVCCCRTILAGDLPAPAGKGSGPLIVQPDGRLGGEIKFWLESSLQRVYLDTQPGSAASPELLVPRDGQVSFQACLRNERMRALNVRCAVTGGEGLNVRVRRVGYVPMRFGTTDTPASELDRGPGFVPDPLFNDQIADVGPFENTAFWITVKVPTDAQPGVNELGIHFSFLKDKTAELKASVEVSRFTLKPRHDFPVIHWWRGECLWDYYQTGMFEDEKLWSITRNYIQDMVDHGTDSIYVPIFHFRRETFKRPCQLLKVTEPEPGKYAFDFSDVHRFVQLARACGAKHYEWSAFWIYWGAKNPVRVYKWVEGKAVMLWPPDADGHGPVFHNFMKQFLTEFHQFLVAEGILEQSFFHVSDEPGEGEHLANYKKARTFLQENAPWMKGKVIDALSSIQYGKQHLTDHPIPIIGAAQAYIDAKIPHWVYFCCSPRGTYLQRLLDTPLPKIRMSGWLFYKLQAQGFLHWGYNYWHAMEQEKLINPFETATNESWPGIPPGDPFEVYPGPDGKPIDSIRWEVFYESLLDYAMLQSADIKPDDPMLADLKSYADFPKTQAWLEQARRRILK
jgi:hypothetical protein